MKIVAIGAGSHAVLFHGPALAELARQIPDLELGAVCDVDRARAEDFSRQFGFGRVYTDYRQMLGAEKPDAVTMVTPVGLTAEIGSWILDNNYPLLMEKPPGRNLAEHAQLLAAYRRRRTPHLIAFNRRYMPLVIRARQWWAELSGNEPVTHYRSDFYRHDRHDADFSTTAVHGIDLVAHWVNSPCRRAAAEPQRNADGETASVSLWCEFANHASAQFVFCPLSGCSFERIHVSSQNYGMTLELPVFKTSDVPGRILFYRRGEFWRSFAGEVAPDWMTGGFYGEIRAFIEILKHPSANCAPADLERVAATIELTTLVRESILDGQPHQITEK